jgi:small-conductance mechanosensitive channel
MSPTPEYVALQSQYQTLESQYQQVRQGLNQSLAQNVKLQQAAQSEQTAQSQMAGLIAHLQGMVTLLESTSAILGVAFVALAFVYLRRVRE